MSEPMTEQWLEYLGAIGIAWCNEEQFAALIAEVRRLRELHADALRQIKLIQEKANREIARLEADLALGFCCKHNTNCTCEHCRNTCHA